MWAPFQLIIQEKKKKNIYLNQPLDQCYSKYVTVYVLSEPRWSLCCSWSTTAWEFL